MLLVQVLGVWTECQALGRSEAPMTVRSELMTGGPAEVT